jgi:hypothetical protein
MSKMTLSIPESTFMKLDDLKNYFDSNTYSGIFTIGAETLYWLMIQKQLDFETLALKNTSKGIIIKELPLVKMQGCSIADLLLEKFQKNSDIEKQILLK